MKVATTVQQQTLHVEFDDRLDQVAKAAANQPQDPDDDDNPDEEERPGYVVGDEMRVKQVIINILANAVKFTPRGGTITFVTKLVYPDLDAVDASNGLDHPTTDISKPPLLTGNSDSHTTAVEHSDASDSPTAQPSTEKDIEKGVPDAEVGATLSRQNTRANASAVPERRSDFLVVRLEVHDTGPGLRLNDVVDGKLFSAYVQV